MSVFGLDIKKDVQISRDEIINTSSKSCRPTSCTNEASGAIKIDTVGPGCKFKAMQSCKADSSCIIKTAIDNVSDQLLKQKTSGGLDMGKSIIQVSKSDTKKELSKKIENAVADQCGGAQVVQSTNRPIEIRVCEGEFDVSQLGDARSKCVLDSLTATKTRSTVDTATDNATSTMVMLVVVGVLGLGGIWVFMKLKSR